jgi:hypothetical protein
MNVFKIEKMNRGQLLQICKIMNIKASKKHTKAQLITKLLKPLGRKYMMDNNAKKRMKKIGRLALAGAIAGGLLTLPNPKHSDVACAVDNGSPLYEKSVKLSGKFPICDPKYYAFRYVNTGIPNDGSRLYFKPSNEGGVSHKINKEGLYIETKCDKQSCKETKKVPLKTKKQIEQDIEDAKEYVRNAYDITDYDAADEFWNNLP